MYVAEIDGASTGGDVGPPPALRATSPETGEPVEGFFLFRLSDKPVVRPPAGL